MSDRSSGNLPETPPEPGSATGARQGRISGRVVTVLAVSLVLVVLGFLFAWLVW